jgi:hypothetical protein
VPGEAFNILFKDPLAGLGAECVSSSIMVQHKRSRAWKVTRHVTSRSSKRDLAQIACHREGLGIGQLAFILADVLTDSIPVLAERSVPARILSFEPITLFRSYSGIRIPPESRPPVPESKMDSMVVPTEFTYELIPVPGFLHAEIAELV